MKLSLNWMRDYVDLPLDLDMDTLSHDLTMRTVEVEGIENPKDAIEGIVVGVILKVEAHPDADLLRVCMVDAGADHDLQIVCGGSNLYIGQKVAVAVPGSMVRWHGEGDPVEIKSAKLRGVLSEGMICGANELDLEDLFPPEDDHSIMDLKDFEANAGEALGDVLDLDDLILEIDNKSMTNRPDLWGHYGMARELAAIYGLDLKPLPKFELSGDERSYPVEIETDNCMRYAAAVFSGLSVEAAPFWMQKRLWSVGLRPINNLVDITNYVMLATGQPTHGFDLDHVPNGITVRQAKAGETLELLDETVLDLDSTDMLITDTKVPIALAGVMGGKKDSILNETKEMVLEVASFDAMCVRRQATRHGLRTEASTRFEKAIDTARVDQALGLAAYFIHELYPDASITAFGEAKGIETKPKQIEVDLDFLTTRMGREISVDDVAKLLEPLGITVVSETDGHFVVEAPVWRSTGDISLPDDILEEVARLIGYENFEFISPSIKLDDFVNQSDVDAKRKIKEVLAFRAGFQEIFTYPWPKREFIDAAGLDTSDWLELEAPPAPDERHVRGSLIPGMLEAVVKNIRFVDQFKIFELAQVFKKGHMTPSDPDEVLPHQERHLAFALVGHDAMSLFREAKGVVEAIPRLASLEGLGFTQSEKPSYADPKMWLNITDQEGQVIGSIALASLQTEHLAGIKHHLVVLAELNVDALTALPSRTNVYEPLPQYPEVWLDMNVVVASSIQWKQIEEAIAPFVKRSRFTEEYYGKQLPEGTKSIIFRYWIGSSERTLTAELIDEESKKVLAVLEKTCGAKLRS